MGKNRNSIGKEIAREARRSYPVEAPAPGVVESQIAFVLERLDRGEDVSGDAAKLLAGWLKQALAAIQNQQEKK